MEKNDLQPVFYKGENEGNEKRKYINNYQIKNKSLLTSKHSVGLSEKIANGVHRSDTLSHKFCSELLEELTSAVPNPTDLNRTGVDLLSLNFGAVIDEIIAALLPTLKQVPEFDIRTNCTVSLLSAYVVGYQHGKPSHHPIHADDSDITLNINLGKKFEGGDLFFLDPITKRIIASTSHSVGKAVIHAGELPHGTKSLTSGERYNLIIWLKKQYSFEQFSLLPKEVQRYALNFFDVRQLCRLSQTCKSMKLMIYEADSAWSRFLPSDDVRDTSPPIKPFGSRAQLITPPPLQSDENEKANRNAVIEMYKQNKFSYPKLLLVVKEIIDTERVYFTSLKHAVIHGIQPLFEANADSIKDASVVRDLQQIVECHELLLQELESCVDLRKKDAELNVINVVTIFDLLIQRLNSYVNYVPKYQALQNVLRKYENNKRVKKFLLEFQNLPESKGLNLESFVIMPVRRVPRYQLLFSEMNKYTGSLSNSEDVAKLTQQFLSATEMYGTIVNNQVRLQQAQQEIVDDKDEDGRPDEKGHKRCIVS